MKCNLTKEEVEKIVLEVVREKSGQPGVTPRTRFGKDLREDGKARRRYFFGIEDALREKGCSLKNLSPGNFESAGTVQDVIDMTWNSIDK